MLSNKGVETADQCKRGVATQQPITTLLIFLVWSTEPLLFLFDWIGSYFYPVFPFFHVVTPHMTFPHKPDIGAAEELKSV